MSEPGKSSSDPEPSCSNTVLEIHEQKVNTSEVIKTRDYRPAPACRKRKREEKNFEENNIELLKMCKPFSIKLERLPQLAISKILKKCDHVVRTKRRHRWSKGFTDKVRKRSKSEKCTEMSTEKSTEKSKKSETREKFSETNNISNSSMEPEHPWGCCRMIPFEINQSRNHKKSFLSKNRHSIDPGCSQTEIQNTKITEHAVSTMLLRDRKLSQEGKPSSSKSKENETPTDIAKKHDSHSQLSLPVKEKRTSSAKEESTSKTVEDEFVCRRILPYIRKTRCKPLLKSPHNAIAQALSSKHSAQSKSVQNNNLKELKQKTSESSLKRETRISETEKYAGCSKTESFTLKSSYREKEQNLNKLSNSDMTLEIRERPSELESKICEKTDETKVPEPKVSRDYDNEENVEDINFTWYSSNRWKYKRKPRRISSSSSEEEILRKKPKISTAVDCRNSSEIKPGPSSIKNKRKSYSGMQALCPPSCMHTEHQGHINFLYSKPKVKPLKEGRVLLQRLEEIKNDLEVIRWRNKLIKLEMEEVEEEEKEEMEEREVERDLDEDGKDSRYHVMHDDRTVSNEVLSPETIYQMREMTDFGTMGASYQGYNKTNPCQGQLLGNFTLDMTKYYNNAVDEPQHFENDIRQVDLTKDDKALDHLLRDDDDIPLEFSKYPKVLLIRLENLVGSFETEYSASEIENLEEKFIDFMMNSNFSYDKQSQSFFEVYKRLHTKRAKDRELEMLNRESPFYANEDILEVHELEESDSRDDYVDEKPLVIALDAERVVPRNVEWVSDVSSNNSASEDIRASSVNKDSEIEIITPLPNDANQSNKSPVCGNNEISPIEFVTCENVSKEAESLKEDLLYITCKFCKVSFKNLHAFSLHKAECHVKNKQNLMCEYCANQYKCSRALKLHIQSVHEKDNSVPQKQKTSHKLTEKTNSKANEKTSSKVNDKTSSKANETKSVTNNHKKKLIPATQHLSCGVCSVTFESKETLWDHIVKHTERELQDAYNDAKKNKDPELEKKVKTPKKKKVKSVKSNKSKSSSKENGESKKDQRQLPTKYNQWKDRILYKINTNDEADNNVSTSRDSNENQTDEIILSSSGSEVCIESNKDCEILDINSSTSQGFVINNTKSAQDDIDPSKVVTMCPCHRNDTSTMVNGDMQIEMVLLCNICQVLFRRRDCFEVHYRVNKSCNMDRTSRTPKLFCSYCRIILNSLPEMRVHLEKHAEINRQGHVTFLCNICKVMFFGVGSLFYSHWFNHNKDVSFLASRYSFPKFSIVQIVNTSNKAIQKQKEEYLFVAEYVCKECKIPFGSEADLRKHACALLRASAQVPVLASVSSTKSQEITQPNQNVTVRVTCLACNKVFSNKKEYDVHERVHNHLNSTKPQYICVSSDANEKAYICTQCKTVRMSIEDLKEHWIFHRAWREKFICANCPELRSSLFEEIETHCKKCFKNLVAVCAVVLVSASHQCKSCNLHFETSKELKEHCLMCSPSPLSYITRTGTAELRNDLLNPPVLPSAIHTVESSVSSAAPATTFAAPLTVVSSVPPTLPSSVTSSVTPLIPFTSATSTAASVTPSLSSSNNTNPVLSKPVSSIFKPASFDLLKKYLSLRSAPKPKAKSKRQVSQDVEIIDILSESSSRSSVAEGHRNKNPALNAHDAPSTLDVDPFDSYIPGNLKSKHGRKGASFSKSVVCYPPKRKDSKNKPKPIPTKDLANTTNVQENTISIDSEKTSLAMTAVNPEFEFLLSELENLEKSTDSSKNSNAPRNVRKKSVNTECNRETSLLNTPSAENSPNIYEDACSSVASETSSSLKRTEKETLTPLPFEVVLLQDEEADSLKSGSASQIPTAQVNINSNKSTNPENTEISIPDQFTNNNSASSDKDTPSETNTASIIEEYIEYIMMDEAATDKTADKAKPAPDNTVPIEVTSKVEKVAPTRLRVRSLAELQEIKMHHCNVCGQSFDSMKKFEEHTQLHNCVLPQSTGILQRPLPPPYREPIQDSRPQFDNSGEINYREALTQNLVRRGVITANMDYVPPLVPFSVQQLNSSTSKTNMTPVSPNLVIPDKKGKQFLPSKNQQTYSNNTGVITPSNTSRFNTSGSNNAPRSGTIQLPERTGVSVLQKRPSGAATRIQNLSHSQRSMAPSVIQHRGLPQVYAGRQSGKVSHSLVTSTRPPNYTSGATMTIRPGLENPSSSLTCETCNFVAKTVSEFSSHLIMHYMENSKESTNQSANVNHLRNHDQSMDAALRNSPNTSRCQTLPTPEGDVISEKSAPVSGSWQTSARYIYACQLCDFRTESKASIRLHEKNHSTVALMRQKNLERLQNHQMIQQTFQIQQQQQQQQNQSHFLPTYSQLVDHNKLNQPTTVANHDTNGVSLYNRVSGDIFQCQLCNQFLFKSQEEFNRHLNNSHKETRKEVVIETGDSSTVCFVCDYCETPQIFESEVNLRKHMNFLHNHICQICSLRCTSRELLQSHVLIHKLENQI